MNGKNDKMIKGKMGSKSGHPAPETVLSFIMLYS